MAGSLRKCVGVGQLDESVLKRFCYRFGLGVNLELVVDAAEVEGDGVHGHAEFCGCRFVVVAFDEHSLTSRRAPFGGCAFELVFVAHQGQVAKAVVS